MSSLSPQFAYVDEGGGPLPGGLRLYAVAAVLTCPDCDEALRLGLHSLLMPGQRHLHHYDMNHRRRIEVAHGIASLPLTGAIVVSKATPPTQQEPTRRRLLGWLLPRLQHEEGVGTVFVESRSSNDRHDIRTRDRLRRSRAIDRDLRLEHAPKRDLAQLWAADFLIGVYTAAMLRGETQPWEIVTSAHVIDVHEV